MGNQQEQLKPANAVRRYEITAEKLPVHCPMPGMMQWNSHPRVYIDMTQGHGRCPYCSAEYVLKEGA